MKNDNQGFSLVELIIVIAIMGVLLTVVAPLYLNYLGKSQLAVCRENRDRLKKDMYNELIAFGKNDMEASAYLDEYMEKAGFKKVSTNTYEGICSTNGVVTFEIEGIDSVEAINISAKCSVHGGDEIVVVNQEDKENNHEIKIEYSQLENGSNLYNSNKMNTINIGKVAKVETTDARLEIKPCVQIAATQQSAAWNAILNSLKKTLVDDSSEISIVREKMKNDFVTIVGEDKMSVATNQNAYNKMVNEYCNNVFTVNELQMSLGEIRNGLIDNSLKNGIKVPVKQYLYYKIWVPNQIGRIDEQQHQYVLYATRTIELEAKGVDSKTAIPYIDALIEGKGDTYADSKGILSLGVDPTAEESAVFTKTSSREEDWKIVNEVALPYKIISE